MTTNPALSFISSVVNWGEMQSTFLFLDLVISWSCWYTVKPNNAVLLLAIGSALKGQNILWLYIAGDWDPSYSNGLVSFLTVMLEVGWFFLDHIASISTLYRCNHFYKDTLPLWYSLIGIQGCSLAVGAVLRILRNTCRFGTCAAQTGPILDASIAANVVLTEFLLLVALMYKCLEHKAKVKKGSSTEKTALSLYGSIIRESYMRIYLSLSLGLMEVLGYITQFGFQGVQFPSALGWFFFNGIYARQMCPTILIATILSTREYIKKERTVTSRTGQKSNK